MFSRRQLPALRPAVSPTLLTDKSNQILLSILSFLDLKSLENLQLTNRKMRQLFLSFLWNNLFIVTFRVPVPYLLRISHHELFRERYFQKFPEELQRYHDMIRRKRAEIEDQAKRRLENMEKERIRKKKELREKKNQVNGVQPWELRILVVFLLFDFVGAFAKMSVYDMSSFSCYSEPIECNDYSREQAYSSIIAYGLIFVNFLCVMISENFGYFGRKVKEIADQVCRTVLKLIVTIAAAIFEVSLYSNIMESPCNGYTDDDDPDHCVISVNSGAMVYLVSAFLLGCIGLFHAYKLYLELCVSWNAPTRPQPLLGNDYADDFDDE